jgi:hypothetical protein
MAVPLHFVCHFYINNKIMVLRFWFCVIGQNGVSSVKHVDRVGGRFIGNTDSIA